MDKKVSALSAHSDSTNGSEGSGGAKRASIESPCASGRTEKPAAGPMTVDRVNALRVFIESHTDSLVRSLLTGKESADKRGIIESAFRSCREAFMEVSTVLVNLLEEKSSYLENIKDIRKVVDNAIGMKLTQRDAVLELNSELKPQTGRKITYATIASTPDSVRVSRDSTVQVQPTTCFFVVPSDKNSEKFKSSRDTKETLLRHLKPAECGLKVNKILPALNNGVRIEAITPDLEKIKMHPDLAKAGLKVVENVKSNPRLIVHGVPVEMTKEEIVEELIAQNLNEMDGSEIKFVYSFPPKENKRSVSCILEVSPAVRRALFRSGRIYLRYSACTFSDHIRVLQCYRCLRFGHTATNCKFDPSCGHCSEAHEMRDCTVRAGPPRCCNCLRQRNPAMENLNHAATDINKCPVLAGRIKDKLLFINYG